MRVRDVCLKGILVEFNTKLIKSFVTAILCAMFVLSTTPAYTRAAYTTPEGINVISGSIAINQGSSFYTITASSDKTIIEADSFDINQGQYFVIQLPSQASSFLTRVVGGNPTRINGSLFTNGFFALVNPNGIETGSYACISGNSIILSTRDIDNQDFLDGNLIFKKLSDDQIDKLLLNKGSIFVRQGGFGALIAGAVENQGKIYASLSKVIFASGDAVKLNLSSDGLISVAIDEPTAQTILDVNGNRITDQIKNTGTIQSDGGQVILSAQSLPDIFNKAINLEGTTQANRIELSANGDIVSFGTVKANTLNEKGASFNIAGSYAVAKTTAENDDGAVVIGKPNETTNYQGLIQDPQDIIVTNDAKIFLTFNTIFHADSDTNGSGLFTMMPGSNINLNNFSLDIYASEDSILRDIFGTQSLTLHESKSGSNPTYYTGYTYDIPSFTLDNAGLYKFTGNGGDGSSENPFKIKTLKDLQSIALYLDKNYELANDIDASKTSLWNGGKGFKTIDGLSEEGFVGSLNGDGNIISNLYIHDFAYNGYNHSLFISIKGAVLNLGLEKIDVFVSGSGSALAIINEGTIENCYATGAVASEGGGGLVSTNWGTIRNSYAAVELSVSDEDHLGGAFGGLVAENWGTIENSYATGNVFGGSENVGGLVGAHNSGIITNCYATGDVTGYDYVGGLVGMNSSVIKNSYATGNIEGIIIEEEHNYRLGGRGIGGLVGVSWFGSITNSYATGNVTGYEDVGGLAGLSNNPGIITNSYFTDANHDNGAGTLITQEQLNQKETFQNWSFAPSEGYIWKIDEGSAPYLFWEYSYGADIDRDGKVWLSDWAILRTNFSRTSDDPLYNPLADFNQDGRVWLSDWATFRANFGSGI
ncbi:MAG: GLUG motif-containing protein [Candidatus Omnitrophota bacterium]